MELSFRVDQDYLITHTFWCHERERYSSDEGRPDIVALLNLAWERSEPSYDLLAGREIRPKGIGSVVANLSKYLVGLKESPEFRTVLAQTQSYLERCRDQWEANRERTEAWVQELTGLDLNKDMVILITHPSQKNGRYLGDHVITWGHSEDWPNYTTVYLWHEILHSYFLSFSESEHAVIEVIADEELRIRLNGGSYPPFVGHEDLAERKTGLLPEWQKYLLAPGDILSFAAEAK